MKIYALAFAVAGSLATAGAAEASGYIKAFGGVDFAPDNSYGNTDYEMETGYNFGAAIGQDFANGWSLEGEVSTRMSEYSCCGTKNELLNLSANAYYTFETNSTLKPYVGVGLGYGKLSFSEDGEFSDWVLTYQLIAGARVAVSDSIDLFGEYRFVGTEMGDGDFGIEWEYQTSALSAGLRFNF